jgi:hypothetical protein
VVRLLGILAVAKALFPIKTKLWVRDFMLTSEGKHRKTNENLLQKKEAHLQLNRQFLVGAVIGCGFVFRSAICVFCPVCQYYLFYGLQ